MRRPIVFAFIAALGVSLDLLSKAFVFRHLEPGDVYALWPGVLHIVTAENRGVAFSLLKEHPAIIICVSLVAITVLAAIYWRVRKNAAAILLIALCLLLVGAIGNLIDRVTLHYVRDFIDFVPPLPLIGHWAVFNVADMCITVGVALYFIAELRRKPQS